MKSLLNLCNLQYLHGRYRLVDKNIKQHVNEVSTFTAAIRCQVLSWTQNYNQCQAFAERSFTWQQFTTKCFHGQV